MANVLNTDKQIMVIGALAEGSSIRSIARMTGVHRDTIARLGLKVGQGNSTMPQPKPKKMGRPRLPKDHARSGRIQVRLNADEQKRIAAAAKASKKTVSDWARGILMTALQV